MMDEQKWSTPVILGILQLAHHNTEIDQGTTEVKITRCPKKYKELKWQNQKEEEKKGKEKKQEEKKQKKDEKRQKK